MLTINKCCRLQEFYALRLLPFLGLDFRWEYIHQQHIANKSADVQYQGVICEIDFVHHNWVIFACIFTSLASHYIGRVRFTPRRWRSNLPLLQIAKQAENLSVVFSFLENLDVFAKLFEPARDFPWVLGGFVCLRSRTPLGSSSPRTTTGSK
jgi:hypothetical protein